MESILIKTAFRGIHCWPEAPEEVEFLRYPHRHIFRVEVVIDVVHSDRDVEFFLAQRDAERLILIIMGTAYNDHFGMNLIQLGHQSCEMMARALGLAMIKYHGYNILRCSVSEDGENEGNWSPDDQ